MADLLIEHLRKKGEEHSALAMLVNQWGFDEKLIPKALQTVGSMFPHYSRHDESHSRQILINIERLLGESLGLLTATDTWLLLEAAYWHDIGMVVPHKDLAEALEDKDFKPYLESIRNAPNHSLHSFCMQFSLNDMSRCFSGAGTPIEAVDKFRELMAEWFRRKHPQRAQAIVNSPWDAAGISSPRTELIPSRLFRLLGKICQMHGASFDDLLSSNGLPFKEAGLAQEDCHPRFVACLLRMGDLLDLDDNRFCPVMQKIAGANRPDISKAHEDKHAGMRHLRIDREYIAISAECETIEGYLETFKWFDWLKQEMQDQMANWQNIVPNRALGLLPTLGPISVRLNGRLQILNEGQRPQFTVDVTKAKELLQGSNLYKNEYACIRELLQNSVDSSLLNVWLIRKNKIDAEWLAPTSETVAAAFDDCRISVSMTEVELNDEKSEWTFEIGDRGTGISREDLAYMLSIGGSQRNLNRQSYINSMPEWMKPSGVFGIGFQSVFLICDKVTITTKSIFSNEILRVVMHSPTKDKEGLVLVEILPNDVARPYGTTIQFSLEFSKFSNRRFLSPESPLTSRVMGNLDPILDDRFPFDASRIADNVCEFSQNALIPIEVRLITADGKVAEAKSGGVGENLGDSWRWNFMVVEGQDLRIRYRPKRHYHFFEDITCFYRGQTFSHDFSLPYADVQIDLMSGKAGNWLNANRDSLATKASESFESLVLMALVRQVKMDVNDVEFLGQIKVDLPVYSLFLEAMATRYSGDWIQLAARFAGEWLKLPIGIGGTLRSQFRKKSWVLGVEPEFQDDEPFTENCDLLVEEDILQLILREWMKKPNASIQALDSSELPGAPPTNTKMCYSLKLVKQAPFSKLALANRLNEKVNGLYVNSRYCLDVLDDRWARLFVKPDVSMRAERLFTKRIPTANVVLVPFLFRTEILRMKKTSLVECNTLDELCSWIRPHLVQEQPISEIRKAYVEFITYLDQEIMRPSRYWKAWKAARKI